MSDKALHEQSLSELATGLRSGEFSSVELFVVTLAHEMVNWVATWDVQFHLDVVKFVISEGIYPPAVWYLVGHVITVIKSNCIHGIGHNTAAPFWLRYATMCDNIFCVLIILKSIIAVPWVC